MQMFLVFFIEIQIHILILDQYLFCWVLIQIPIITRWDGQQESRMILLNCCFIQMMKVVEYHEYYLIMIHINIYSGTICVWSTKLNHSHYKISTNLYKHSLLSYVNQIARYEISWASRVNLERGLSQPVNTYFLHIYNCIYKSLTNFCNCNFISPSYLLLAVCC